MAELHSIAPPQADAAMHLNQTIPMAAMYLTKISESESKLQHT